MLLIFIISISFYGILCYYLSDISMTNYCHNAECAGTGHSNTKQICREWWTWRENDINWSYIRNWRMIKIVLQIVSEHEAVRLKTVTSLDTMSRGSGIMLRCQENWILKCDGGLDRGVLDYCSWRENCILFVWLWVPMFRFLYQWTPHRWGKGAATTFMVDNKIDICLS